MVMIKLMWYWSSGRQTEQWNKTENTEADKYLKET